METWINFAWQAGIAVIATAVAAFTWTFFSVKLDYLNKPFRLCEYGGTVRPWPPIWLLIGGFLGLIVIANVLANLPASDAMPLETIISCAVIAPLAIFSVSLALPGAHVSWNEHGIEGPSGGFNLRRVQIAWGNIVRAGASFGGSYFVQNHEGGRVCWSDAHIGKHYVWNALIARRPDLIEQVKRAVAARD